MSSHKEKFDEEYFIDGVKKRKSMYKNFRWKPEISFPIANTIKELYPNRRVLDYGCAKGYITYALRLLNVESYGYDTSKYALANCKKEVKKYLYGKKEDLPFVDLFFIKDVLEHFEYEKIDDELKWIQNNCKEAFVIVPLGSDDEYRISEYSYDKTHIIMEDEEWWSKKFINAGFIVDKFSHNLNGLKDKWIKHNKYGNGFFQLSQED